jgi:hypothetical protein
VPVELYPLLWNATEGCVHSLVFQHRAMQKTGSMTISEELFNAATEDLRTLSEGRMARPEGFEPPTFWFVE